MLVAATGPPLQRLAVMSQELGLVGLEILTKSLSNLANLWCAPN